MRAALEVIWLWLFLIFWVAAAVLTGVGLGLLSFVALHYIAG